MSENKTQGLSLLDIAPNLTEKISIGAAHLEVRGISAKNIVMLFQRFPQLQSWFRGAGVDLKGLIDEAPDALAAIIAAGAGMPGIDEAEETASNLPVEIQLDILEAIGRLTFRNGFGPFAVRIVGLLDAAQSENYGRVQATKSPPVSKPSLPPGTPQQMSGT